MERGTKIFKRMLGVVLAIVMCMTLTTVQTPTEVQAASGLSSYKRVSFYKSQKIGNTVYSMKYNDRYNRYTMYMRRNGKTQALVRDCSGGSFVTNGKVIYYTSGNFFLMVHLEEITKIFESNSIRSVPESPEHCFINQDLRDLWHRLPVMELIFILVFAHSMVVHIII